MNIWFIHSLVAVTAIGGMMALYKVPSAKGHNKYTFSFLSFVVATSMAFVLLKSHIYFDSRTMLFGFLWGSGFAVVTMLQMELLKRLDTNAIFPITSMSSHVLVVVLGLTFFHDSLSPLQIIGIITAFLVVGFYNRIHKHISLSSGLLPMVTGLVVLSAGTKFVQKFGSISVDTNNFIFWQLFFATIASFVIFCIVKRNDIGKKMLVSKQMLLWAIGLGALNFIGTLEIVRALSTGPFSLVYTINSFYILLTSVIAWRFFGEKLTGHKVFFLLFAIVSVVLIGLG